MFTATCAPSSADQRAPGIPSSRLLISRGPRTRWSAGGLLPVADDERCQLSGAFVREEKLGTFQLGNVLGTWDQVA